MRNRYLLFLNNNTSNMKFLIELKNTSSSPNFYEFKDFDAVIPDEMSYGEYDFFLIRCALPYEVTWSPELLDCLLTVDCPDGSMFSSEIRWLPGETGILSFMPNDPYKAVDLYDSTSPNIYIYE